MQYGTSEFKLKWCGAQKPHAMALMLHCYVLTFEFAKIAMQNVRKAKANFASNEGAQSNFKWLYCIVILLLCRAPIEHREYASMSIAQLPPPFLFVH